MSFEFFDRKSDVAIRQGTLPHWYQPGVTYFVTFRTEDSVPQSLLKSWHARREEWLREHGINPLDTNWQSRLNAVPQLHKQYHSQFTREFMEYLDRGMGACVLRRPELAKIVGDSLTHFNGVRYHLGDFVVMPNHVHLLVCLLGSTEIEKQCESWKHYTAVKFNRALGKRGRFWQEESFDHLVRSPEQFEAFQKYIAENPVRAGLHDGEYLLWRLGESR